VDPNERPRSGQGSWAFGQVQYSRRKAGLRSMEKKAATQGCSSRRSGGSAPRTATTHIECHRQRRRLREGPQSTRTRVLVKKSSSRGESWRTSDERAEGDAEVAPRLPEEVGQVGEDHLGWKGKRMTASSPHAQRERRHDRGERGIVDSSTHGRRARRRRGIFSRLAAKWSWRGRWDC